MRQTEYAELEKTQTRQQENLETLKKAIAGAQADLGRAEGTQKALEEQLNKEIAEAEKEPGVEEVRVLQRKRALQRIGIMQRRTTETSLSVRLKKCCLSGKTGRNSAGKNSLRHRQR